MALMAGDYEIPTESGESSTAASGWGNILPVSDIRKFEVVGGPNIIPPDTVARLVKFPDGSGRLETWNGLAWVKGEADMAAYILFSAPASQEELRRFGVVSFD